MNCLLMPPLPTAQPSFIAITYVADCCVLLLSWHPPFWFTRQMPALLLPPITVPPYQWLSPSSLFVFVAITVFLVRHPCTVLLLCLVLWSSIIHHPSSIVHRPLSIVHCPLSIVHRPSSIIHRQSSIVSCQHSSSIVHRCVVSLSATFPPRHCNHK